MPDDERWCTDCVHRIPDAKHPGQYECLQRICVNRDHWHRRPRQAALELDGADPAPSKGRES